MESLIQSLSDTALEVAVARSRESKRPDALFRDEFAACLVGERGEHIARSNLFGERMAWVLVMRTYLYDQFIAEQIEQGVDLVVNLGAGLDTRPYRMMLPPTLTWIEVDLPALLDHKEKTLWNEKPECDLQRVRLDVSDVSARRGLFAHLGCLGKNTLVITEGLLIYFSSAEVGALSRDLADIATFKHWIVDVISPGLLRIAQKKMSHRLQGADTSFKFGPREGPEFFVPYGWRPLTVRSPLKTAARFHRIPFLLRMLAALPSSNGTQGLLPWSGICLLGRT